MLQVFVPKKPIQNEGFALVIALSLMAFVLLLLLSMTTLVLVESKSAQSQMMRIEAEQAALLSLNIAIGKLQETAGLDQRVTAPAESVAGVNGPKQLTGVWRSWEGRDHQSNGLPIAPDYASKLVTGDQEIDVDSSQAGRFLGWLVSEANDPTSADANTPPDLVEDVGVTVPLVSVGSVGSGSVDKEVHVTPSELADGSSAIAWWITGENTKALLEEKVDPADVAGWRERLATTSGADAAAFQITNTDDLGLISSRESLDYLPNTVAAANTLSQEYFHDVTTYSRGLLTNTANGGWRRDLSLLSEQWADLPSTELPFFSISPGVETAGSKASGNTHDLLDLIYPWAGSGSIASVSWNALVDFAKQYDSITSSPSVGISQLPAAHYLQSDTALRRDRVSRFPALARIHYVLSLSSISASGGFSPCVILSPVVTLWNPHSVALDVDYDLKYRFYETTPLRFTFDVGGTNYGPVGLGQLVQGDGRSSTVDIVLPLSTDPVWQPGEVRVYSATGTSISTASSHRLTLGIGYRTNTGVRLVLKEDYDGANMVLDGSTGFSVISVDTRATRNTNSGFGVGAYIGINVGNGSSFGTHMNMRIPVNDTDRYWSDGMDLKTNASVTLSSVDSSSKSAVFYSVTYGLRTTLDMNPDDSIPIVKSLFDFDPLRSSYQEFPDSNQLANRFEVYPYEYTFIPLSDINSPDAPSGLDEELTGYMGASFRASEGSNNLVISELPTRPLRSLGELQHFQINATNSRPPYTLNAIGNSSASALISADNVVVGSELTSASYDNSYVSNHLFFDDWFVSSVAPETQADTGVVLRTKEEVYARFISGEETLPNAAYLPAELVSVDEADSFANDFLDPAITPNSWHDVAAELEVNGMFNINSTSVPAWKALLSHANGASVAHLNASNVVVETGGDTPVARTTLAGDPSASSDTEYTKLGTHLRLSDSQVQALAEEIVEQIKARGPFLSLSEFINRRLVSGDTSLSLAGAIEAALGELSSQASATTNPYSSLQNEFFEDVTLLTDTSFFSFLEATDGNLAYGFPGWVRQADVVRPLAPKLTVRDDTFVIRSYGSSKDPLTGETEAEAWCEVVVQRRADYVDDAIDSKTVLPSESTLDSEINKRFGRRFSVVSFRWLSEEDV